MRQALCAEWAKTRTDRLAALLFGALCVLTVAVGAVAIGTSRCAATGCGQDPARLSLTGVYLGQAVAALAGVLAIGGEYATGMIGVTLTAMPRRVVVLAAKALVLAAPVFAASALAAGASMLAGALLLPGHGFTRGFDLSGPAMWRAAGCAALYLTLVALLGLGVTAIVRDAAVATGAVLGLLYLFPVIALAAGHSVSRVLERFGPMSAGTDAMATAGPPGLPLSDWEGLGVVALWAAAALILGALVLRTRDVPS
jgi:ABC-2 type transport system permease protein